MVKRKKVALKDKQIHHKHFFIGGITAFFFAGALLGSMFIMQQIVAGQFAGQVHAFNPGQVISNANYDVQLTSVTRGNGGEGSMPLAAGKTYLIVDLYVKNKTNKVLEMFPMNQAYIKDDQGQTYSIGAAAVAQPFMGGDLAPGDNLKGEVAFEIPVSIKNPKFYLEGLAALPVVVQL